MYLHIGKDKVIKKKDLICILNLESFKKNDKISNIINKLEEEKKLVNLSEYKKTLILVNDNNKIIGYISNISSVTLCKRT